MATGELLERADFAVAYPEIRNQLLQQVGIGQEQRLDLRSQVITALQTTSDIPTQARYIDLLTQIAESAGWWVPTLDYIAADMEAFNRYKSALEVMKLNPDQMEELLPQNGEAIQPNPKPRSPTLRNDPEDVFMHFAVERSIDASGIWQKGKPYEGLVNFVEFIRQHPEVLPFIKELCTESFNRGNLSSPPIFDGFHWYTPQGQAREGIPMAEDFYQA